MHRLCYVSRSLLNGDMGAIEALRTKSVAYNAAHDIRGALYYDHDMFFQVLEGPKEAVKTLFDAIRADGRHEDVTLLVVESVDTALFDPWEMKFVSGISLATDQVPFDYDAVRHSDLRSLQQRTALLRAA